MKEEKIKNAIKAGIAITIFATIVIFIATIMMQYNEEGEKNMPFELSKITIVSTAEGIEKSKTEASNSNIENSNETNNSDANNNNEEKKNNNENSIEQKQEESKENSTWKFDVIQNNDLYFTISKNESYGKEEVIKSVKINNIKILEGPKVGAIKAYMPNSLEGKRFNYQDEYLVEEELTYKGSSKSNEKNLEIGNQGGSFSFSLCNTELGTYESNDDTEIKHDASLIEKMGKKEEDLKFKISFDLSIELEKKTYITTVTIDLPCENLLSQGKSTKIIDNTSQFIFKRAN